MPKHRPANIKSCLNESAKLPAHGRVMRNDTPVPTVARGSVASGFQPMYAKDKGYFTHGIPKHGPVTTITDPDILAEYQRKYGG